MANPGLLKVLRQGVETWNRRRFENNREIPNLIGAKLDDADLIGIDLSRAKLSRAKLSQAKLSSANLARACLSDANLSGANLYGAKLGGANLRGANLSGASLIHADLFRADLSSVNLDGADLSNANLFGANLFGAKLARSNLFGANLVHASLGDADLDGSNLRNTNLINANLSGANLSGANLSGANLSEAILAKADFLGVSLAGTTLGNTDLSKVKNLESVIHYGPSIIGVDTLYKSLGNIPQKFLLKCGVPLDLIKYLHSHTLELSNFKSCFISYSSKDGEFVERLHADLEHEGVQCWFAPKDLKIGDNVRVRIHETIRLYDKMILVLSRNSIKSQWVGGEVEVALDRESKQKKEVLLPIRLDDAVMKRRAGWPDHIRVTRNIGDFKEWKNASAYRQAFDRLMRDLKAEVRR